jgi:hypothetical protein
MSINSITFLDRIISHRLFCFSEYLYTHFYFLDFIEVKQFLETLEIDKTYVLTFELIISDFGDDEVFPVITLSKPILITKNSNASVVSKFIKNKISLADEKFGLDIDLIINMKINDSSPPCVLVKYNQISLY